MVLCNRELHARNDDDDRLVSGGLLNARWVQLKWVAVQTADCRRHGHVSDYAWRSIDAAAADERVTDHNRAYCVCCTCESALLDTPRSKIGIQAIS